MFPTSHGFDVYEFCRILVLLHSQPICTSPTCRVDLRFKLHLHLKSIALLREKLVYFHHYPMITRLYKIVGSISHHHCYLSVSGRHQGQYITPEPPEYCRRGEFIVLCACFHLFRCSCFHPSHKILVDILFRIISPKLAS